MNEPPDIDGIEARVRELEVVLADVTRDRVDAEQRAARWRAELIAAETARADLQRRYDHDTTWLRARVSDAHAQLLNVDELVTAMEQTVSWRVTRPLRAARRQVRRPPSAGDLLEAGALVAPAVPPISEEPQPEEREPARDELIRFIGRLGVVTALLTDAPSEAGDVVDALDRFAAALDSSALDDGRAAWLGHVAATGSYPDSMKLDAARRAVHRGGGAELCKYIERTFITELACRGPLPDLEVVRGMVLVDVTHTTMYDLLTGIQRVTRECASRWLDDHSDAVLVHFNEDDRALKRLDERERERTIVWRDHLHAAGGEITRRIAVEATGATIVPWGCIHVIPELVDWWERVAAYSTLRDSGVIAGVSMIGYDLIPITAAEFTAQGVTEAFGHYLSLVKRASAVSVISRATADEFRSYFGALAAQGLRPPHVTATPLPAGSLEVSADDLEVTRARFRIGPLPLVLVVGSHEPRKNHITVLEAAEALWQSGHRFELLFVGGASWGRADFEQEVGRLQETGYPVQVYKRITEDALWSLYRLADFSVFISYLEGYGLPVAESLSSGTPVITTNYGSMAEIAEGGGAVTVDPRDVGAVRSAMAELLSDGVRLAELRREAAQRQWLTWDDYARQLWGDLVESVRAPSAVADDG